MFFFAYIQILAFLICLFISFFLFNGNKILKEKIDVKQQELDKEKKRLIAIENDKIFKML